MRIHTTKSRGFTLIELLTVIVVMSILLSGGWVVGNSYFAYIDSSRDTERSADVNSLAQQFEAYYRDKAYIAGATYPTTTQVSSSLTSLISSNALDATKAPGATASSVVVATSTSTTSPGPNSGSPTISEYVYQPFSATGSLCTSSNPPCVRFVFYYRDEQTNTLNAVSSVRQQ